VASQEAIDRVVEDLQGPLDGAEIVLLGEATHGTREFYEVRSAITRRLIADRGFRAVAVEADWPSAARVNR
jgi:erythromycin esterase-like protein